jgi:GT2 family glycosyltransferase
MHSKNEAVALGWCDNGMADGKFAEGITITMLQYPDLITGVVRAQGNQIARQRQTLMDEWYTRNDTDWLLWVDSDIVLTPQVFKTLWDVADKATKPIVVGTYFISKESEQSMMAVFPCLFTDTDDEWNLKYVHPLPDNQVVKVDAAGMGLTLMHRSVVTRLREKFPDESVFTEILMPDKFVGEDIAFFRHVKQVGIPVYAHTGATVKHMKRFALDENYYHNFWQIQMLMTQQRKKDDRVSKLV